MCFGCQKCILYHHKIMSCHDCKTIYHGICSKSILKFSHSTGKWICLQCLSNKKPVYNPFDNIGYDKHDPFNMVECDDINTISEILKSCQTHDRASFNSIISNPVNTGKDTMSIDSNGVIVPGFSTHSDLSISICIAKVRLKSYLFTYQMSGDPITWS